MSLFYWKKVKAFVVTLNRLKTPSHSFISQLWYTIPERFARTVCPFPSLGYPYQRTYPLIVIGNSFSSVGRNWALSEQERYPSCLVLQAQHTLGPAHSSCANLIYTDNFVNGLNTQIKLRDVEWLDHLKPKRWQNWGLSYSWSDPQITLYFAEQ